GHLVLDEIDHEQLQGAPCEFLFFDRNDLADAMRRIDNEFTGLEILTLRRLFRGHSLDPSLTLWPGAAGRLGHGELHGGLRPDVVTNCVVRLISRANLLLKRAKADVHKAPRPELRLSVARVCAEQPFARQ